MSDWQTIAVALIIFGALIYTARRALKRLRSFGANGREKLSDCATACGKCGDHDGERRTPSQTTTSAPVRISRTRTGTRS